MPQRNSNLDTSHSWSRTDTVTHLSTNIAHCRLTSVSREIVITLCHNLWKSDGRRTYVWEKAERTCVLLAIGGQDRQIQNQCKKDICMGKSPKDMCPFSYWRVREANSECTGVVKFIKVRRQRKNKVICRSQCICMLQIMNEKAT